MSANLDFTHSSVVTQYSKALSAGVLRFALGAVLSAAVTFAILAGQLGGIAPAASVLAGWLAALHGHLAARAIPPGDWLVGTAVGVACIVVLGPVLGFQFTRWRLPGLKATAILPDQQRTLLLHLGADKIFALLKQILETDTTLYDLGFDEGAGLLTARSLPFARYRDRAPAMPGMATRDAGAVRAAARLLRKHVVRYVDPLFIGGPRRFISIEVIARVPAQTEVTARNRFRTLLPILDASAQNRRTVEAIVEALKARTPRLIAEQRAQTEREQLDRQLLDARLQVLRAQIEPHFLYNTLANVQYLIRNDAPAADAMVGELITYLRRSLPKMRDAESTVGGEIALARSYLNILRIRMGGRLSFSVELPPALAMHAFPPMMLMSLVENAINHGLEPKSGRGSITIDVTADADTLRIEVRDDGVGFGAATGSGIGLKNVRETLASMFGDYAD